MERNKAIIGKFGIIFLIILVLTVFAMKKEDRENAAIEPQEEIQEAEWQIEEDDAAAIGNNLFSGSSMVEADDSLYLLDIGRYGGKPVDEDGRYNVYQMKEGECEVTVSYYSLSTMTIISNLAYLDGYIYFVRKEVDAWEDETAADSYIFKVTENGGDLECMWPCDGNFYIYEDEIYVELYDKGTRYFYRTKLDKEDKEVLYSDEQEDASGSGYTVGGGCLYLKDGNQILGINLKTGERKYFETGAGHIGGMFYENGRLYIYDTENGEIYQIDVRTGDESKLIEGKILADCVWVHDGYLYYVEGEEGTEGFRCKLKAMDVMTGEAILWESVLFDTQPHGAMLETVGSRVIASFRAKREDGAEEYRYFEKEIKEIVDAGDMKIWEILSREERSKKRTIVIQEGFREDEWQAREDEERAIGYNLNCSAVSAEGNGCIYSTDIGKYDGKPPENNGEDNGANIYRLKEGKWELFVSHPAIEEDPRWAEISVYNLTYYKGYLYYILLRDYDPSTGSSGKNYSICRASEQGGDTEELAKCNGCFYIYQDKIYYDGIGKGGKYFRMELDGSNKELIYFDDGKKYYQFAYAVGGNHLYIRNREQIMGISLGDDEEKILTYFDVSDVPVKFGNSIFYEDGKLYFFDVSDPVIYQLDIRTGEVSKVLENFAEYECGQPLDYDCIRFPDYHHMQMFADFFRNHSWICNGYLYYVDWKRTAERDNYEFKVMDIATGEIITWESTFVEKETIVWDSLFVAKAPDTTINLEVIGNRVIVKLSVVYENEISEDRYFVKEINEIMEMEWGQ